MSWITQVINSTKELETPTSFWYWSSIAGISAVLKDNVWISRGGAYNLYPNVYVMLLAGSALKKGPPIGLMKRVVQIVGNTKVIVGRSSIQAILKELSEHKSAPGGQISKSSTGFVVASEFSSSLVEDPAAFNLLTDLYDRHYNVDAWRSLLKSDTFTLHNPTITMLVATNEPHLRDFVGEKDVYGGFFGRMFVIKELETSTINSLIKKLKNPPIPEQLAEHLKVISTLRGEFKDLDGTAAGKLYDEWYNDFMLTIKRNKIEDKTGTLGRFSDSVMKVAMILSLSRAPELEITLPDMEEAIAVCEKFVEGTRRAVMGVNGKQQYAYQKALIINEIMERENHQVTRKILLRKFWMDLSVSELDEIMGSFDEAGLIKPHAYGNDLVYEMSESVYKAMCERLRGKQEE